MIIFRVTSFFQLISIFLLKSISYDASDIYVSAIWHQIIALNLQVFWLHWMNTNSKTSINYEPRICHDYLSPSDINGMSYQSINLKLKVTHQINYERQHLQLLEMLLKGTLLIFVTISIFMSVCPSHLCQTRVSNTYQKRCWKKSCTSYIGKSRE